MKRKVVHLKDREAKADTKRQGEQFPFQWAKCTDKHPNNIPGDYDFNTIRHSCCGGNHVHICRTTSLCLFTKAQSSRTSIYNNKFNIYSFKQMWNLQYYTEIPVCGLTVISTPKYLFYSTLPPEAVTVLGVPWSNITLTSNN